MKFRSLYRSPLGNIILLANNKYLLGLWFEDQIISNKILSDSLEKDNDIILKTKRWLDLYFARLKPNFDIPILFIGTKFQEEVWKILLEIPYGNITTYGEIAQKIAQKRNIKKMSAQAVGNALNRNNISIIVPCHRVVGKNNNLVGYAGGLNRKEELLKIEGVL